MIALVTCFVASAAAGFSTVMWLTERRKYAASVRELSAEKEAHALVSFRYRRMVEVVHEKLRPTDKSVADAAREYQQRITAVRASGLGWMADRLENAHGTKGNA